MSIRLAVIGAGVMGADHARIFAEKIPGVTLQVVCDADVKRAKTVADQTGASNMSQDPEGTIQRADVDAVLIASPDHTHAALTNACIASNKPVLCEKPLSQSTGECLQVIEAEQKAQKKLVIVGFMRRFDQSYVEMKTALDNGQLGRALMMHNLHRNVETPHADFTGAMAITNSAPHEFDVARYVLGSEYQSVTAYQPRRSDKVVAPVMMVLETAQGQLVTIEINNNAAYGYDVRAELVGEAGSISMNNVAYSRLDKKLTSSTAYDEDWRGRYAEAYRRQNAAFVDFIQTGKFPADAADSWDGYCAAVVAEAGVRALESGAKQPVEMQPVPDFYRR